MKHRPSNANLGSKMIPRRSPLYIKLIQSKPLLAVCYVAALFIGASAARASVVFTDWTVFSLRQIDGVITRPDSQQIALSGTGDISQFRPNELLGRTNTIGQATYFSDTSVFQPNLVMSDSVGVIVGGTGFGDPRQVTFTVSGGTLLNPVVYASGISTGRSLTIDRPFEILAPSIGFRVDGNTLVASSSGGLVALQLPGSISSFTISSDDRFVDTIAVQVGEPIPEPGSALLLALSFAGLLLRRQRAINLFF